ncbi:MAG: hypothetical protein R3C52_14650 [Hyphomonadaceae bacterium]
MCRSTDIADYLLPVVGEYALALRYWRGFLSIADRVDAVNQNEHGEVFRFLQSDFSELCVVRLASLFEVRTRNKVHSLPQLIRDLPAFTPISGTVSIKFLESPAYQLDAQDLASLASIESVSERIGHYYSLSKERVSGSLVAVKALRDQQIAHRDRNLAQPIHPAQGDIEELFVLARRTINLIFATYRNPEIAADGQPIAGVGWGYPGLERALNEMVDPVS